MRERPLMGHVERHVNSRTGHHAAKSTLRRSLLELAQHTDDREPAHFERTRLVQTRVVQRYAEEVRCLFFFLLITWRRQQFECLAHGIGGLFVSEVAQETLRDDSFVCRWRRDHPARRKLLETTRVV